MAQHRIRIGQRDIGPDQPPFIIAELSANHNGSLQAALDTISAAKEAGADAIKLQTYTADTLTIDCDSPLFTIDGGLWHGQTLYALYQEAHTPWSWHGELFAHARKLGLLCFSSPFDDSAISLLESLACPAYKIASFELVDLPLIRAVAATGKPMIMSTGMASLVEIEEAVATARQAGCQQLALLHCISGYPTPIEQANLATLQDLGQRFEVVIGLSDHTLGTTAATAACALGASIIEKHFILDRSIGGPDASFSITPPELARLVSDCRDAWLAIGKSGYARKEAEAGNSIFRRSLFFVADIAAGEVITPAHVRSIRPGYGLAPKYLPQVIGQKVRHAIARGTPVSWEQLA